MGIRGLDHWVKERKLSQTAPLTALRGTRLGIDAKHYIDHLLHHKDSKEPFVQATGGYPLSIPLRIENDFHTLTRCEIKPVMIFAGLPIQSLGPPKSHTMQDTRDSQTRERAWDLYEVGETEPAVELFGSIKGSGDAWRDIFRMVLRIMKQRSIEYIICPYLEHSQLSYLLNHPKGYIHAIYSSDEALLFPVDKVITSIEWPTSFTFIDKSRLVRDMQLSDDQFLDFGILAGSTLSRTLPIITSDYAPISAVDIIKTYHSGLGAIDFFNPRDGLKMGNYREEFLKTRTAIRHGFILSTEGTVVPLSLAISDRIKQADVPELDTVFSSRLPAELYYYISQGLISPTVIGWLTTGYLVEHAPLSDSDDYQKYVRERITESPTSPRILALAILQDALHPQWKERRVTAHYYSSNDQSGTLLRLNDSKTINLVKTLSTWTLPLNYLKDELLRQKASNIDIALCIETISDPRMVTKSLQKHDKPLDRKDEFLWNAILRYLTIRQFINPDHTLSMAGKGLHSALTHSRGNDNFKEPLIIIIELLRFGALHGFKIGDEYKSGGELEDGQDGTSSMLILRCLSVLPLTFRPQQYTGPLSRELLVFNSFARSIQRSSRQLMEIVCTHMFLTGVVKRQRDNWAEIILSLPFQSDCNTGYGILFSAYLNMTLYQYKQSNPNPNPTQQVPPATPDSMDSDQTATSTSTSADTVTINDSNKDSDSAKKAKEEALGFVEGNFEGVKNPRQEVERGFRFWDAILDAVRVMAKLQLEGKEVEIGSQSLNDVKQTLEEFEIADRWLQPLRP